MVVAQTPNYQGIIFPERAERLKEFGAYRVFLDHWDELSLSLGEKFEGVALRGESRILAVHGEQGRGKTLFAQQLTKDFERTKKERSNIYEPNNLWHRISGGTEKDISLVSSATNNAVCIHIEDNEKWIEEITSQMKGNRDRNYIIIADNAERAYFRQGLVGVSVSDFLNLQDRPDFLAMVAQKLVHSLRTSMARCLLVLLSNNEIFLGNLESAVSAQHAGLLEFKPLPVPGSQAKEAIVRINTNRLNKISYWYCLDKAGPDDKKAAYVALSGAESFPASFQAVNTAIRRAAAVRIGRPAKKNVISLVVLGNYEKYSRPSGLAGEIDTVDVEHKWFASVKMKSNWAKGAIIDEREQGLLESEWQLRYVFLGNPFVRSLLSSNSTHLSQLRAIFDFLKPVYGPGTLATTRDDVAREGVRMIDSWQDDMTVNANDFWKMGQVRSTVYEKRLSDILPDYNKNADGFLSYRPDLTIIPFQPCSILKSGSPDQVAINTAIRRDAHVFEFCALNSVDGNAIQNYLSKKLPNYVAITQEQ